MMVQTGRPNSAAPKVVAPPQRLNFGALTGVDSIVNAALPTEPKSDVFVRTGVVLESSKVGAQVKALLSADGDKKANALELFTRITGVRPLGAVSTPADEAKQAELKQLAESIQQLAPAQRLALVKAVTGPESPYSQVAEKVLINQQLPTLKEFANMFKPDFKANAKQPGVEGVTAAIQAVGVGLLMMPIACPASVLFRPELLGQVMGALALKLI